ncbi:MAG: hypothetical protein FWC16_01940 [Defluviitaleaceae bacterium]|nr:hypothetical protein [Defluviitaleaceae bacterium]MCL2273660.1 hypothetical protein [Defluviitaleaceae bacterium]
MKPKEEILEIISNPPFAERYSRFSSIQHYPVATGGVIALAEAAGCYWFLDIIGSYQTNKRLDPHFQVWKLAVNHEDDTAVAGGYNDTELIIKQDIPYTDFPLDELNLYLMDGVILLPSEY